MLAEAIDLFKETSAKPLIPCLLHQACMYHIVPRFPGRAQDGSHEPPC